MWKVQPNHFEQSLFAAFAVVFLATTAPSLAGFDSGSDGSDGALDCNVFVAKGCTDACATSTTCNAEIDLSLAASLCDCDGGGILDDPCRWDCPSPVPGQGVYDAAQWAVVFKYTLIDIPVAVRVKFKNHPKGAPVVWLSASDVVFGGGATSAGNVSVSGSNNSSAVRYSNPGPGGFTGGAGLTTVGASQIEGSAGFGPGGGAIGVMNSNGGGAGYSSQGEIGSGTGGGAGGRVYGNPGVVPFVGGSGGGGNDTASSAGGGAGGGAILIAASGNIDLGPGAGDVAINANGGTGNGGGSGGAIRLIANTILGAGTLQAIGADGGGTGTDGVGGDGRIRLEAFTIRSMVNAGFPLYTATDPGPVFPPAGTPTLKAVMVDSVPISSDPRAGVQTVDAQVLTNDTVTLHIEATNIPVGTVVDVIVTPAVGGSFTVPSTQLAGSLAQSTATAQLTLPPGTTDIVLLAEPTP